MRKILLSCKLGFARLQYLCLSTEDDFRLSRPAPGPLPFRLSEFIYGLNLTPYIPVARPPPTRRVSRSSLKRKHHGAPFAPTPRKLSRGAIRGALLQGEHPDGTASFD